MTKLRTTFTRGWGGLWYFDDEETNTYAEPLLNGTEKVVDMYYYRETGFEPEPGSTIYGTVTDEREVCDVILHKHTEDSSYYIDDEGRELWLCPWLEHKFSTRPDVLYVRLLSTE